MLPKAPGDAEKSPLTRAATLPWKAPSHGKALETEGPDAPSAQLTNDPQLERLKYLAANIVYSAKKKKRSLKSRVSFQVNLKILHLKLK